MFLRMVWVAREPVSTPALNKNSARSAVSSLSEALDSFSSVVVTGGSSGIGKSFIELAAKLKPELQFCNLSRRAPLIKNSEKLKLRHIPCDLAQPTEIARAATEVEAFIAREIPAGRMLLINNSGFGTYGRFPEPNLEQNLQMIDVNVRAVVDLTARLLPLLKAQGGVIMTIASVSAFQPMAYSAAYGATKAFVLHWSLALNEELRGSGVSTLAVCPGTTATEFFERAGVKPRAMAERAESSEQVVHSALRALRAGKAQVVSGARNKLLVAALTKLPKPLAARIVAQALDGYYQKQVRP
jgi:uncharacterized protein